MVVSEGSAQDMGRLPILFVFGGFRPSDALVGHIVPTKMHLKRATPLYYRSTHPKIGPKTI